MAQQLHPQHDDVDVRIPTQAGIPTQSRRSEPAEVTPRPFALGSSVDVTIPAPRRESAGRGGSTLDPRPTPAPTRPTPQRNRTTVLVVVAVLAVVLLLCGLYAASAVRDRTASAASPAPVPGLHEVVYTVTTGHGSPVMVDYSQASSSGEYVTGSATDVPSPWRADTQVKDDYGPSLDATIMSGDDSITCTIVEHGRTVAQTTQSGPGASVSCLP